MPVTSGTSNFSEFIALTPNAGAVIQRIAITDDGKQSATLKVIFATWLTSSQRLATAFPHARNFSAICVE